MTEFKPTHTDPFGTKVQLLHDTVYKQYSLAPGVVLLDEKMRMFWVTEEDFNHTDRKKRRDRYPLLEE